MITEGRFAGGYGWDGGLGTSWLVHPAADLVVVMLTQRTLKCPRVGSSGNGVLWGNRREIRCAGDIASDSR